MTDDMADTDDYVLQLTAALEKRGMVRACAAEVVGNIRHNKVELIYWNEADKERIVLHAYDLARARSALQDALARDPDAEGHEVIHRCICDIDEHFTAHHWPSAIAEDDPILLKELWHRQQNRIIAARQLPDDGTRATRIAGLASEGNRILGTLLGLPATVSARGEVAPVTTRDLVAALQTGADRLVATVAEAELEARYPAAYDFLAAVYGCRITARLNRILELRGMSSRGFSQSPMQNRQALTALIANLGIARNALGQEHFSRMTGSWDTLAKVRLVAVADLHAGGVILGGYHLAYPVQYAGVKMPPWMENSSAGELKVEGPGDLGTYLLLSDIATTARSGDAVRDRLHAQYLDYQNKLIKPNYDALQLIVAHCDKMTKLTAQTIVSLLGQMVEAYRQVALRAEGDSARDRYDALAQELDGLWDELTQHDELPVLVRDRIIRLRESPLAEVDSVHSLIRFLHERGNRALERQMTAARADSTISVGRIGGERVEHIQIARLDDAPIIANGLIRHRTVAAIVRAAQWLRAPVPGTFVLIGNHVSYSVRLGEHRVELSANIERPDNEGFIRLQCYQGGVEIGQQLRGAFVARVLREAGLTVTCDQDGLVDALLIGVLDKDHGARTDFQIEQAMILVLRLIWSLRDLDYAMAYLFSQEVLSGAGADKAAAAQIDDFALSLARMFLVEGTIPFTYRGEGMPFDTYCEYSGPKALREFRAYVSDERQMTRYRLYFTLNALLRAIDLPVMESGRGGVGQEVIDKCFNRPVRQALGRGELRLDARGVIERNPAYQPLKEIISTVVSQENEALRTAVLLKMTDLHLDFRTIGSIDQLTLVRAQQEIAPNEWLVIYGLADDANRANLFAFGRHPTSQSDGEWLSRTGLRRILRKAGYAVPGKVQVPAFRKLVSHRLLVEQPRARSRFIGTSVRGLLASVGDGSVRIGRVTFDRSYCFDPRTRDGRVLLVPFTTPEDIEAIRAAEAVLVTSGGLLSHAGVTTREFAIPALILPNAEWVQSPDGVTVRLEESHPGKTRKTDEGFWVSDSMESESVTVREGDIVLVWASQGIVSVIPMAGRHLEHAHDLIRQVMSGEKLPADLELWLASLPHAMEARPQQIICDTLALVLAEALWDKRIELPVRKQLIDLVQRARTGIRVDGRTVKLPEKSASYINALVESVSQNVFTELERLLSEVEHNISTVTELWRALNIVAVVERLWTQVRELAVSLNLGGPPLSGFERRIDILRRHPRIALLRSSALHEVESLSGREVTEADLPAVRKTLRRLGHSMSGTKPQRILLVCTANVDRSPMAEFLLKKMLAEEGVRGVEVLSRGVAALENRPMSDTGQALLLAEDGISAAIHRSRRIAEADVRDADLILAMEHFHVRWVSDAYPPAADRVFLLSGYGRVRELGDIEDPAGQLGDAYYRMKREVRLALTGVLKRMRAEGILAKAMVAHLQARADELTRTKRERIAATRRTVVPLEEVDADSVELVGGKGANLGEIAQIVKRHGGQIPPALMVTTFAFERFLEENGIGEAYAGMTAAIDAIFGSLELSDEDKRRQILDTSERIRDLILGGRLDPAAGVGREIMAAVEACELRNTCLSVRSSGLQEDTEEAAFAGAAETYLCVNPAELPNWIKKVWMSFWLTRGILYRGSRIVRQGTVKLAVVVQKMFDSQVSGIMFTTDPVSGRDVIVIEAGYGLGEGVVSGLIDVDRYYVDKFDGSVTSVHVGKKAFMVKQHPSGRGTSIVPVENELRDIPCLKEDDIRANIAMALEDHYALSQDIEFGIADGKVSILQTRPITTR